MTEEITKALIPTTLELMGLVSSTPGCAVRGTVYLLGIGLYV